MENHWRRNGRRRVNIDPGYVADMKLVLATTKDAAQRVHLGRGIYAEATLHFVSGCFQAQPHTYPDYAADEAIAFFNEVRARYMVQRRGLRRA
jgi:hypothetical protein